MNRIRIGVRRPRALLTGAGVGCALAMLTFATPIRSWVERDAILHSEGASSEAISTLLLNDPKPDALAWKIWQTRKIPQRQAVLEYLRTASVTNQEFGRRMTPLLELAALDADASLRELALPLLEAQRNPHFIDLARAQLQDADSQVRLLGLEYLRKSGDKQLTPEVLAVLTDSDSLVVANADSILRKWTGQDFGLRLRDMIPQETTDSTSGTISGNLNALHETVAQWNNWWRSNQQDYPGVPSSSVRFHVRPELPTAGDFILQDLDGRSVHLSEFKGKTVWLNFWTTWCPACQEEIPRLIELQKKHPADLVILGVNLDGGEVDEDDAVEAGTESDGKAPANEPAARKKKIERVIKSRGINYRILLDPDGSIGARFNGHELPTNVLIDSRGEVRRRFVGTRSQETFEVMFDAATKAP